MVNFKKIISSDYQKTIVFNYLAIAVNVITGFILFPLILKYLGNENLAIFGIFYSIKSFVDIGVGWLSASITKNILRYKYLKDTIFTFSFLINNLYGCVSFIIFLSYGYFVKNDFFISACFFGIFVALSFFVLPFYEMFIGNLEQSKVAFFRFLQQFLFFIASVSIFYIKLEKSLDIIFECLAISSIFIYFIVFFNYKNKYKIKFEFTHINKVLINKIVLKDGKDIFLNAILIISILQIDVLLLGCLYGTTSVAIYLIMWKVPNTIIMLGWRFSEPFSPIVSKQIKSDKNVAYYHFMVLEKKILLLAFIASTSYLIFGEFILGIWLGKENIPNMPFMYLASSIVIFLSIIQRLYISINFYTRDLNIVNIMLLGELLCKIFFTIFLFWYFKELSPICGWVISLIVIIFFYRRNACRVLK